jgi:hypothetical protein
MANIAWEDQEEALARKSGNGGKRDRDAVSYGQRRSFSV